MIKLEHITLGYGPHVLLEDATVQIPSSRLVALLGRNGTGKSSLLRSMVGLEHLLKGTIWYDDKELCRLSPSEQARVVSLVTTERIRVPHLRVADVVGLGRSPYTGWTGKLRPQDEAAVESSLHLVGMAAYALRTMDTLSDGECQRVMIARALAQDTPVVLLDEPTSFLDLPNRYELCLLLKRLAEEAGKTLLFSTHELDIALSLADTVMLIDAPHLYCLPTPLMVQSGHIERLFSTSAFSLKIEEHSGGEYAVRVEPSLDNSHLFYCES